MANIILPPSWQLKESAATDQSAYIHRRAFVKAMGLGSIGLSALSLGCASNAQSNSGPDGPLDTIPDNAPRQGLPAAHNEAYTVPERKLTDRIVASSYTNMYEFRCTGDLKTAWPFTEAYQPFPGTITVDGLAKEQTLDIADLIRSMDLEERLYRFRCVEAWSMTIPWVGFPLAKLIERCEPTNQARFVQFTSINRPSEFPGMKDCHWYDWPYYEGLRMDEALNELAFVATGMYGEPLPKQNGSPLRLVLPWKYGYKGPKAITKITFTRRQPKTFWNDAAPNEYGFLSNVNPNIPHRRWTQAREKFLISDINAPIMLRTQIFNGYDEWVGALYPDEPRAPAGPIVR